MSATCWDSNGRPYQGDEHEVGLRCPCLPTLEPDPGQKPWITHEWPKLYAVARGGIGHP